jgi:hypothetical protein
MRVSSLKQTSLQDGTIQVQVVADHIKGSFLCDEVSVKKLDS